MEVDVFGWDDALVAGASLVGGLFGQNKTDKRLQSQQAFQAEQVQQQMDFQERMSNSAYQRAVKDMRKAGINPMLAYSKGGASAPSGSAGSGSFAPASDILSPAASSALHSKRLNAEVDNMVETNKNLVEQNKNLASERARIGATTANILADTKIKHELFQAASRDAAKAKTEEEWYKTDMGKLFRTLGLGASEVGKVFGGR